MCEVRGAQVRARIIDSSLSRLALCICFSILIVRENASMSVCVYVCDRYTGNDRDEAPALA